MNLGIFNFCSYILVVRSASVGISSYFLCPFIVHCTNDATIHSVQLYMHTNSYKSIVGMGLLRTRRCIPVILRRNIFIYTQAVDQNKLYFFTKDLVT